MLCLVSQHWVGKHRKHASVSLLANLYPQLSPPNCSCRVFFVRVDVILCLAGLLKIDRALPK